MTQQLTYQLDWPIDTWQESVGHAYTVIETLRLQSPEFRLAFDNSTTCRWTTTVHPQMNVVKFVIDIHVPEAIASWLLLQYPKDRSQISN